MYTILTVPINRKEKDRYCSFSFIWRKNECCPIRLKAISANVEVIWIGQEVTIYINL